MGQWPVKAWKRVAVQGNAGAYAHLAASEVCPKAEVVFCGTFEEAFEVAAAGKVDGAVVPVENSTMGRIADIHHLMEDIKGLRILGEHFLPIRHCLLGVKGASLSDVKEAHSQLPALMQCRKTLKKMKIVPVDAADTAGAAKDVKAWGDTSKAAVASRLAAKVYGLDILQKDINDELNNSTRFLLLGREEWVPSPKERSLTTVMFRVRDIPAALYKALGGFATNGINLGKIESYMLGGKFEVAQFYVDCEGHVDSVGMCNALEELRFFSEFVRVLGCYPAGSQKS